MAQPLLNPSFVRFTLPFRKLALTLLLGCSAAATTGCGSADREGFEDAPAPLPPVPGVPTEKTGTAGGETVSLIEKPWEVISDQGETYLPNIFYAEAIENEQIIPTTIDGHMMIDRLIYPTLGNPNLYAKDDPKDSFTVVLRIEDGALAHMKPQTTPPAAGSGWSPVTLDESTLDNLAIFLIPRVARAAATEHTGVTTPGPGTNVYQIRPSEMYLHTVGDMPAAFAARKTMRLVFRQDAMANIPAGLYDVRFEIRRDGNLFSLSGQTNGVYEYQFNALRVFDKSSETYDVINVTDTQVSVGDLYDSKTQAKLDDFVDYVSRTTDPMVRKAAFITFNGDLHNGGSPGTLRQRGVAMTYNDEAKVIINALKRLTFPIFLVPGNHDGYASTGLAPRAVELVDDVALDSMEKVVNDFNPKAWPGFRWSTYQAYRERIADQPGGLPIDLFSGAFRKRANADTVGNAFSEVRREQRNMILYDGFYQWQKTVGPLYASWRFGKNFYMNLNTYDLRQHRRSGWGMFTVNYGGGISPFQMEWIKRDIARANTESLDIVLLGHHDPRGGHKGKDLGYYYRQLDYKNVQQSAVNYLVGKAFNPAVCRLPEWATSDAQGSSCIHDGLNEWMAPDGDFDCAESDRKGGTCDTSLFDPSKGDAARGYDFSGFRLLDLMNSNPNVRTLLLGHTHYNSLEILKSGDNTIADEFILDEATKKAVLSGEVENPIRGYAQATSGNDYDPSTISKAQLDKLAEQYTGLFKAGSKGMRRKVEGDATREIAVIRLTSNADLANQSYKGKSMLGFSVLHVAAAADARNYIAPQINSATFFINVGTDKFDTVNTVNIPRVTHLGPHQPGNPVSELFD